MLHTSQQKSYSFNKHVFLIEDDPSMRKSLSTMLEYLGYQLKSFASAIEFLDHPIDVAPAVVISDMRMPGMSGIELQVELIKKGRQIPIIFISAESTIDQSITAMKQGAIEFLLKPFEREDLLSAIVRGLDIDSRNTANYLRQQELEADLRRLSPREREVFELLTLGFNNQEIMDRLGISLPTAKQYKSEVMRKLNFRSLSELIKFKS
ncbi:MAG: response regulator [Betaproteobacteria bacterium]